LEEARDRGGGGSSWGLAVTPGQDFNVVRLQGHRGHPAVFRLNLNGIKLKNIETKKKRKK
jgi:hypothetical protein